MVLLLEALLRFVGLRLVHSHIEQSGNRYRWRRAINYLAGVIAALLIARIWTDGLQNLGVSFGLASAGLAIALRDPIVCLVG